MRPITLHLAIGPRAMNHFLRLQYSKQFFDAVKSGNAAFSDVRSQSRTIYLTRMPRPGGLAQTEMDALIAAIVHESIHIAIGWSVSNPRDTTIIDKMHDEYEGRYGLSGWREQ